jgi:hypothetical protein
MEFAVNNRKNKKHQHRNDSDGDYPIGSHPI